MTRRWRGIVTVIAAAVALATLAGCTGLGANLTSDATVAPPTSPISATDFAEGFVSVNGSSFALGGTNFRFVGANIYDAAATDAYSCRASTQMSDAELLKTMRYLHDVAGVTVLRFWAYQTYTQGGSDWSGVDRVLAHAKAVGMKVIPVLEDGPGNCTTLSPAVPKLGYEGDTWFTNGYRAPYGNASLSFRDYAKTIAQHYADDPTILGWSMINEAETHARDSNGVSALVGFAKDIASVVRSVDSKHLITVGTQSNGAPGASGPDFIALYSIPEISFAEVHDWGYWGSDSEPMPGGTGATPPPADSAECAASDAPIGCSFAMAVTLKKPLIVGEAGMKGVSTSDRTLRSTRMRDKMDAAFAAGAAGYVVWSVTTAETDGYDISITTNDPLMTQLRLVSDEVW